MLSLGSFTIYGPGSIGPESDDAESESDDAGSVGPDSDASSSDGEQWHHDDAPEHPWFAVIRGLRVGVIFSWCVTTVSVCSFKS